MLTLSLYSANANKVVNLVVKYKLGNAKSVGFLKQVFGFELVGPVF